MPQRDTASFRGQVTQFVSVFVIRYRMRVNDVLPTRNRAVKFRTKKLEVTKGDASRYDVERVKTNSNYGMSRAKAASSSASLITAAIAEQNTQVDSSVNNLRNQEIEEANSEYISYLIEREGRKSILRDLLNEEIELDMVESSSGK